MAARQNNPSIKICVLATALLAAALSPCIAAAALGESQSSVDLDAVQLHGSRKVTDALRYRQHEILLPSGTRLREYTGADGRVFAVAWNGPAMPNLRQALGTYFDGYVAAAKENRSGRHHLQIHQNDLVVQAGGHMRAFTGLAYLQSALPSGVNAGDLR
jgi:hypothetical protein